MKMGALDLQVLPGQPYLGGGLKHFLFSPLITWGNDPFLANVFQMGWNHQLVIQLSNEQQKTGSLGYITGMSCRYWM